MKKIIIVLIVFSLVLAAVVTVYEQNWILVDGLLHARTAFQGRALNDVDRQAYAGLIKTYQHCAALEEAVFAGLSFRLAGAEAQIKKGHMLKLVLLDQFGRKWMFKVIDKFKDAKDAGRDARDDAVRAVVGSFQFKDLTEEEKKTFARIKLLGDKLSFGMLSAAERAKYLLWAEQSVVYSKFTAVPSYRFYSFFGVDSPEIHYKVLNINGRVLLGTMQRVVPYDYTLKERKPDRYSAPALDYLIKVYTLSALFGTADPNPDNYLVHDRNGSMEAVTRIDLSINFPSMSEAFLGIINYADRRSLYAGLWDKYIHRRLDLPLAANEGFIAFVSSFPDDEFNKILGPLADPVTSGILLSRKARLAGELIPFFRRLQAKRGGSLVAPDQGGVPGIADRISQTLEAKTAALEKDLALVGVMRGAGDEEISAPLSQEAYRLVFRLREANEFKGVARDFVRREADRIVNALQQLLARKDNIEQERKALRKYIENVQDYRNKFDREDVRIDLIFQPSRL